MEMNFEKATMGLRGKYIYRSEQGPLHQVTDGTDWILESFKSTILALA